MKGWADDPELIATFRAEVNERLASLCEGLLRLEGDPAPKRLVGALFEYRNLGALELKGIGQPVSVSQVLHPSVVASRFEALRGGELTGL